MATHSFRNLVVWQRAMLLTENVYESIKGLPKTELYALSDQLRRCSVSVPSNIAEGQKRLSSKETVQFSGIALGSLAELQTQFILCERIYSLEVAHLIDECDQIGRMLTVLIRSLRSKN